MTFAQDVVERLLVAKDLLEKIRFLPITRPDHRTLARHILAAHDAAELALAGIARHLGRLPQSSKTYLMDYFPEIRKEHDGEEVPGRDYFAQLNQVRVGIKHQGIFPDPRQWYRVGERTYDYISTWCENYLGIALDDLDESTLISDPQVKQYLNEAKEVFSREDWRGVLESLAWAMEALFRSNGALRNLSVGSPRAEDAIKLSAFGVHANDFLALQEFLPPLVYGPKSTRQIKWEQEEFGHPANWTRAAAEFCLRTFVSVALRIQDAEWIPGAIDFNLVYEHKMTALVDGVEIIQERRKSFFDPLTERTVVRTLHKGEAIRGQVSRKGSAPASVSFGQERKQVLLIANRDEELWGEVEAEKVRVTCVPRDRPLVREYFPDLPEIDHDP